MHLPIARVVLLACLGSAATCMLLGAEHPAQSAPQRAPGSELLFTGRSTTGELQEALDAALATARTELAKHAERLDFSWETAPFGGRSTTEPSSRELVVTIRITRGTPPALQKKVGPGRAADG